MKSNKMRETDLFFGKEYSRSSMKMKTFILRFAGIPGAGVGFEGPMLRLAFGVASLMLLILTTWINVTKNTGMVFSNPLIPLTVFFVMKAFIAGEGDWIVYGPVKIGIAAIIYFFGMSAISGGLWYLWFAVVLGFLISGLIDLLACFYDWQDRRRGRGSESKNEGSAL